MLVASLVIPVAETFAFPTSFVTRRATPRSLPQIGIQHSLATTTTKPLTTTLHMAQNEGPGILPTLGLAAIILIFVGTSFLPLLDAGGNGVSRNLSIADSVVTKQDNPEKFKNYENKFDRLSRATIQEKLNAVPVFYLVDNNDGSIKSDIFLSFEDATDAAKGETVKATTLDQVM
jgi:hypothetical protein